MAVTGCSSSSRRWLPVALCGVAFALLPWKIMALDFRYALAATGGLLCLSLVLIFVSRLDEFLVYALVFHIPFSIFGKWLHVQAVVGPVKGVNLGLPEILLLVAYLSWFCQIFVAKTSPLPKLRRMDLAVIVLFMVNLASLALAENKLLGTFDVIYTAKHLAMYYYLSHKIQEKHVKIIVALLVFAILVESGLAFFERATGYVNIGSIKGNIHSENFGVQYAVPGIENELRASGTTNDSHTLGLYYAMILPAAFIFIVSNRVNMALKLLLGVAAVAGLVGLVLSFSRSGWLGFTAAAMLASWVVIFKWRQGKIVGILLLVALAASCLYPQAYSHVYRRVFQAPGEIMEARSELNATAIDIFLNNVFLGAGPGNYVDALDEPGVRVVEDTDLPVHSLYLYTLAEIGLLGGLVLLLITLAAMRYCWRIACQGRESHARSLGLAVLAGIVGYLVNGLTDPMFREAVPYAQFWTFIALSVALKDAGESLAQDVPRAADHYPPAASQVMPFSP